MDRAGNGIFNEDVTAVMGRFFRDGETLKETAAEVHDAGLGDLETFKGKTDPRDGTMFVSMFSVTDRVFMMLQFAFRKSSDGEVALDHVRAFLRSSAM